MREIGRERERERERERVRELESLGALPLTLLGEKEICFIVDTIHV